MFGASKGAPFWPLFLPRANTIFAKSQVEIFFLVRSTSVVKVDSNMPFQKTLNQSQTVAYALPMLGVNFFIGALTIVSGVYAKYFGLSLSDIATALLIARLFDAVSDPTIGYIADRYRYGIFNRKLLVVLGGGLFVACGWFLFVPTGEVGFAYFLGWYIALYFAHTLFEIPHLAMGNELAASSQEKNRVYGCRAIAANLGMLLFFIVPLLPVFESNAITPDTLRWSALAVACAITPLLYIFIVRVPASVSSASPRSEYVRKKPKSYFKNTVVSIVGNRPLLWFLAAFSSAGVGIGMWFSLVFLLAEAYLGLGGSFAWIFVIGYGVSTLSIEAWRKLSNYWGKQKAWMVAMIGVAIGIFCTMFLAPGESGPLSFLLCLSTIYVGFAAMAILAPSLLADISDYGTWKFDHDRSATYFSLYMLITKGSVAIGGAVGLWIADAYGFDAAATIQSESAVFGLHLAMAWLPAPLVLIAPVFIRLILINTHRHAIIRRCLDKRAERVRKKQQGALFSEYQETISPREVIDV